MYNPSSLHAEEFICHNEIMASIDYASKNRNNLSLIDELIEKSKEKKAFRTVRHLSFYPVQIQKEYKKYTLSRKK